MPRGTSGRIVLEIDPVIKHRLYIELAKCNLTLKDWFLMSCDQYFQNKGQPSLFSETSAEKNPGRS